MVKIQDLRSITPRSNPTRAESQIKFIARHHSATTTGDWFTFWPHWNKSRGWGTGGYAEIILRDGTVQLCYDPHEITNGVANHNTSVYNICIVGNGSFTAEQEAAWDERCRVAMKRFNLPVSAVKGHNEFSGTNTACPGIDMNLVRSRISGKAPATVIPVSNEQRDYFMLGDKLPGVGILQSKLNKVGYKLTVDDIFGEGTETAVYAFQRGNGLLPDGIAGKATMSKLDTIIANINKAPIVNPVSIEKEEEEITLPDLLKLTTNEGKNAQLRVLKRFEKKEPALSALWREKVQDGEFTLHDFAEVFFVAVDRGYITGLVNTDALQEKVENLEKELIATKK